jgi:hypothetical protein
MSTFNGTDWDTDERGCVRDELTRIGRLRDTVLIPHLRDHPDDESAQLVLGQLTGVKCALELLARGERA